MTDETKRIFSAPWTVKHHVHACWEVDFEISTVDRMSVAVSPTEEHANRLAHLPELYDALKESINDKCRKCINGTRRRGDKSYINPYDFIELGCPYNRTCVTSDYLKLLRKVRDGE